MFILSGVLAFDVLDRLTGQWTVMDSQWMQDFALPMIKRNALVWFLINMLFWVLVAFVCVRVLSLLVFASQGTTSVRIRVMQPVILVRTHRATPTYGLAPKPRSPTIAPASFPHATAPRPSLSPAVCAGKVLRVPRHQSDQRGGPRLRRQEYDGHRGVGGRRRRRCQAS
jgi:hypothetical protein